MDAHKNKLKKRKGQLSCDLLFTIEPVQQARCVIFAYRECRAVPQEENNAKEEKSTRNLSKNSLKFGLFRTQGTLLPGALYKKVT